ncbi:MAG TPA: peroxiredoxin [Steroidobacteraceae bacterium]|nr:peroxiredoxin [Steroidobacteraceae bacterium]
MTIKIGDKIPAATLKVMTKDGPSNATTEELFDSGKVVMFSVPGAFTPTCSARHLPGFVDHAAEIAAKGVDRIVCVAVNDVFVMDAWGKSANVGDKIVMAADGNGEFTRALGLELDASGFGMGQRGQRFAVITQDGVVTALNVEAPGEFKVSSAEFVLGQL